MPNELQQTLAGIDHTYRSAGKFHAVTLFGNTAAELIVIHVVISERLEPADGRETFFGCGHGCAESEVNAFQLLRKQGARGKFHRGTSRIQCGSNAAADEASEEDGDRTHFWIGKGGSDVA